MYKCSIIGCGKIAGYFGGKDNTTHGGVISLDKNFIMDSCIDTDIVKGRKFARKFNCDFYKNIKDAFSYKKPDVVVICTPDNSHFQITIEVLRSKYTPKVIFLEKPICLNIDEFKYIKKLSSDKNCKLIVNFSRRFNKRYVQLKHLIKNNFFGNLTQINAIYYGGWFHNASHLIDTIVYLLDEEINWQQITGIDKNKIKEDPSFDIKGKVGKNTFINFRFANEDYFQLFEFDFWFSKSRLKLENFGYDFKYQKVIINNVDEKILIKESLDLPKNEKSNLEIAYGKIFEYLKYSDKNILNLYSIQENELTMNSLLEGKKFYNDFILKNKCS